MKNLLKYSGLLAAGVIATSAIAEPKVAQKFSSSDARAELVAPGAWAAYMELTNTSPAPALITGVSSPQFANANLVTRSRDRFTPQTALFFSAKESGELRSNATHVLLSNPVSTDNWVTINFELSDGSSSATRFQLQPKKSAAGSSPASKSNNHGSRSEREGAKKSRVISHNPTRR